MWTTHIFKKEKNQIKIFSKNFKYLSSFRKIACEDDLTYFV